MTARFFLEDPAEFSREASITQTHNPDVFHHLKDVLRARAGDQVELVAQGAAYLASVSDLTVDRIKFQSITAIAKNPEMPKKITLVLPLLKSDHLDWLIQKATELGCGQIILTNFVYSVAQASKIDRKLPRWKKIIKNAAEQSHRLVLPDLSFQKDYLQTVRLSASQIGLVAWEESAKSGETSNLHASLQKAAQNPAISELVAVLGPEGGISRNEIALLQNAGFICVGLGPRILRAETAPLYLLSAASLLIELS
ncbi:RsmE family RNA methyltransferase [Oenococcus kitaharae]|uniref:Ribosomal RNA small subunit methyltransferase E n=1 Tax=Oenococcus kitaharae DSM 17330 TaxID=1045004 RepID=G9WFG8_9LACO|nr:16S rRNA (uracil(1498)-N(3))-methyltransferase [Oenococcus kitaharae]EHN59125.1 Ribosomal RNA small subunit methyltransferase E [Oenococcus kitaharae DSM 17330]OEY81993.1 16S rRNA methyltransferase [Oenococcus kitaharae]OEY82364.1 16S rRNA methyltransferase [Oenococcus kitaharae]OEY82770.1 16S rRNA methyltransferase [Oenococcus kitaharae]